MPTLPSTPSFDITWETTPALARAQFGDGYQQAAFDGINPFMRRGTANFRGRTLAELDTLETFLQAHCAAGFDVVVAGERPGKFLALAWSRTRGNVTRGAMQVTLAEIPAVVVVPTAAAPTFSPASGPYTSAQSVTLASTTPGATIRYTTDGSAPTASSTAYSGPISVSQSMTIRAIAIASGYANSPASSAAYTINLPQAAAPTFSPAAGTYASAQSVTITSATSGAQIRYTTDGATPTVASPLYSGPVSVAASLTLRAIAFATGFAASNVTSGSYVIGAGSGPAATPTFSIAQAGPTISFSTTSAGATIYYTTTTDGSTPPDPSISSTAYSGPVSIAAGQRFKVFALGGGFTASGILEVEVTQATGAWVAS
jgi:hypothetical protein